MTDTVPAPVTGRPPAHLRFAGGWQIELTDWRLEILDPHDRLNGGSVRLHGEADHATETPPHRTGYLVRADLGLPLPPVSVTRGAVVVQRRRVSEGRDHFYATGAYNRQDHYAPPSGEPLCGVCQDGPADAHVCELCEREMAAAERARALGVDCWTLEPDL